MSLDVKWNAARLVRRLLLKQEMRFTLPNRLGAALFLLFSLGIGIARAGGALSREEFLAAIADQGLREYVSEHYQLAEEGRALRAGRQMPNPGARIAPYEIVARALWGDEMPLVLHLDTEPSTQVLIVPCAESTHYGPKCE